MLAFLSPRPAPGEGGPSAPTGDGGRIIFNLPSQNMTGPGSGAFDLTAVRGLQPDPDPPSSGPAKDTSVSSPDRPEGLMSVSPQVDETLEAAKVSLGPGLLVPPVPLET